MSNFYETIKSAIENKDQVIAVCKGKERKFCPHTLGFTKDNREGVFVNQFDGFSSKGLSPNDPRKNWRSFYLDEISAIKVEHGEWYTADNHSKKQSFIKDVHTEVEWD